MGEGITREQLQWIVARLISKADDVFETDPKEWTDFERGMNLAFYEMLDVLKSELDIAGENIEDYGLDIDLEQTYLKG